MSTFRFCILAIAGSVFLSTVINSIFTPRDDSDHPNGERSGMAIHTDNLTGCQYLSRGIFSSLTPRLAEDGKQICTRTN